MERDFMGLNLKESVIVVKEEAAEGCKDLGYFKDQQVQWPMPYTFDPSNKHQSGENQRNVNENREDSTRFSMTAYPFQQNARAVHVPASNTFFKTQFSGTAQNFMTAPAELHFLGGVPVTAPHTILPSIGSVAWSTEPCSNLKSSRAPAQMTIFYGGTVNVFDNISPEKVQAIMFLAGNRSSVSKVGQAQAPVVSKTVADDVFLKTPSGFGLPSPITACSGLTNNNGTAKTSGALTLTTPVNKVEAPKLATSHGHVTATTMIQSAVPQARKASLARFLEKRKERVTSSAPYNHLTKKSGECTTTPASNGVCFSGSSDMGTASISTSKDSSH